MIEKVNPQHPDKIADRIAGAIVDLAYKKKEEPKVAVEVLIGHGNCYIIAETDVYLDYDEINDIVKRIAGNLCVEFNLVNQDTHLVDNQKDKFRCGDNGIFKGVPVTHEEKALSDISKLIYGLTKTDGKYILDGGRLTICQSNIDKWLAYSTYLELLKDFNLKDITVNPIGDWTGGLNVDSGATNRKLGSDMAQSVTGGGLHGKDLSKADVSVNIYAFLKAQKTGKTVELSCAIGDDVIDGKPYSEIVAIARDYIKSIGGFEKFAEWGLF